MPRPHRAMALAACLLLIELVLNGTGFSPYVMFIANHPLGFSPEGEGVLLHIN